jgi:hypothetical protein
MEMWPWLMGLHMRTFDEKRDAVRLCSCGQHAISGAVVQGCPWRREPIGRWGVRWAQPERSECE